MRYPVLATVCLSLLALLPVSAGAQQRTAVVTLTVVVPRFLRLVVDASGGDGDSLPVVRVITNDPVIRAATVNGIPPELVRLAAVAGPRIWHAKGSDGGTAPGDAEVLIRFTQVAP